MRSVRLIFSKTGPAKYISHLDLTRCLIRAFRRTDIPLWYTEGFNPHPHLVFGLPLPLGVEGERETLDIRLNDEDYTNERLLNSLKNASVPNIEFLTAFEPAHKTLDITFGEYEITLPCDSADSVKGNIESAIASGKILIEKKTKKKEIKVINVCDYIEKLTISCDESFVKINCILPAGNDFTINPVLFMNSLLGKIGMENALHSIVRKKLLIKDYTEFN